MRGVIAKVPTRLRRYGAGETLTVPIRGVTIRTVTKVVARQSLPGGKVRRGDTLNGAWNPKRQQFRWSGSLDDGESLDVMVYHIARCPVVDQPPSETEVSA